MIDVNGFMNNKIEIYGFFQRFFYKNLPIEIGSHYPAEINEKIKSQCKIITEQAAVSCGINFGPIKSDLILKKNKVYILEISSRLHGPKAFYLSSLVDKYNHLERLIKSYTGKTILREKRSSIRDFTHYYQKNLIHLKKYLRKIFLPNILGK